jgi:hypothetical protein
MCICMFNTTMLCADANSTSTNTLSCSIFVEQIQGCENKNETTYPAVNWQHSPQSRMDRDRVKDDRHALCDWVEEPRSLSRRWKMVHPHLNRELWTGASGSPHLGVTKLLRGARGRVVDVTVLHLTSVTVTVTSFMRVCVYEGGLFPVTSPRAAPPRALQYRQSHGHSHG